MPVIHGSKSYLFIAPETVWGVADDPPVYIPLPVDSYGAIFTRTGRNSRPALGIVDEVHNAMFNGALAGQVVLPWYGFEPSGSSTPLAKTITDWAFSNLVDEMPSYQCEWAEGPDVANVLHSGMRVNQVTLAGDAASNRIMWTLDLMGQNETALATAQALPDDRNKAVEAKYSEITFTLGGSPIKLASFSVQQQNSLSAHFNNGDTCDYLTGGDRARLLQFTPVQTGDTWGANNRQFDEVETSATIVIKGRHNGTGASGVFWQHTISMGRIAFINSEEQRGRELKKQPLNFRILKPQSSTAAIVHSWSLTS